MIKDLTFKLRELRYKDSKTVCKLLHTCFKDEYKKTGIDIKNFSNSFKLISVLNKFLRIFNIEFFKVFVVDYDGDVVALTVSYPIDIRNWFFSFVATDPRYRGKGLCTKIMNAHIDFIKRRRGKYATCEIVVENKAPYHVWTSKFNAKDEWIDSIYLFEPKKTGYNLKESDIIIKRSDGSELPKKVMENIEKDIVYSHLSLNKNLLQCFFHWTLPPIIYESYYSKYDNGFVFARVRKNISLNMMGIDYVAYEGVSSENLHSFISDLLRMISKRSSGIAWIYARKNQNKLIQVYDKIGLDYLHDQHHVTHSHALKGGAFR